MRSFNKETVGIVIVAHDCPKQLHKLLTSLKSQLQKNDEVVVVDNHFAHRSASIAKKFNFLSKVVEIENKGFANGCNIGSKHLSKRVDLIFFLNPDTLLGRNCLELLRQNIPIEWSAWMPLLIKKDDNKVNSAGNIVHISGLSWCDGFDKKPTEFAHNKEINFLSGACMMIRKKTFIAIGGMPEEYFLYYEDTAFSNFLLLQGLKVGIVPRAHVYHDYEFLKSKNKWFFIERNRYIYILTCWPLTIIFLLLPFLTLSEIGLWIVSIYERRFILKVRSSISFLRFLPNTIRHRRDIRSKNKISAYTFYTKLESQINTSQLGDLRKFVIFNAFSKYYYSAVYNLLRMFE